MFIAKRHTARGKSLLAVIDSELAGKIITEGKLQLDLSSEFYKGKELSEKQFKEEANHYEALNLVGKRIIEIAKGMGLINHIITVAGIPHAEATILRD